MNYSNEQSRYYAIDSICQLNVYSQACFASVFIVISFHPSFAQIYCAVRHFGSTGAIIAYIQQMSFGSAARVDISIGGLFDASEANVPGLAQG